MAAHDHKMIPPLTSSWLDRCWQWLKSRKRIEDQEVIVLCKDDFFRIELRGALLAQVRWDEVLAIRTYKIDLFTCDCICLAFQLTPTTWVEVREHYAGGDELITKHAPQRFDMPMERWWMDVAFPAFAPNETLIWKRAEQWGQWEMPLKRENHVFLHSAPYVVTP